MSSLIANFAIEAGITVLLADLVSGAVHWVEDAYAARSAADGQLAENNLRHDYHDGIR